MKKFKKIKGAYQYKTIITKGLEGLQEAKRLMEEGWKILKEGPNTIILEKAGFRITMKEALKRVKASRESQKLMTIHNRIRVKHNWSHRGDFDSNWSTYLSEVKNGLRSIGVSQVSPEAIEKLEDENFHALIKALVDLRVAKY